MADPVALVANIRAALATLANVSIFDGQVPTKVPEAGGYILPYVVIWAGVGDNPDELPSDGLHDTDTLIFDFQTTAVGASSDICRRVAIDVKTRLTNTRVGTGRVRPNPDGFQQQTPIPDNSVTPARYMLPIQWRLITN